MDKFMKRYGKPETYRVQWLMPATMAWTISKFETLAAACRFRSDAEKNGIYAVIMPQK